jgi:hypothetical protein
LTAEKLARLLSDVQRLATTAGDRPGQTSNGAGPHAGMIIDPHAHMISRDGEMDEQHWLAPAAIDQRTLFEGNSVLRGGRIPHIEPPGRPTDELRIV